MKQGPEGGDGVAPGGLMWPGVLVGGKYRLEAKLGQGAMGAVWEATHLGLSERVAIKFIDARYAASPGTRQRFETEARAMAKIRSRFVVSVFDTGRLVDGTLYLVMERLRGETLHAYVKRRGLLSLAEAAEYACHVGRALGHAHARGVVHRDVKPSNIFLTDTPDDGRIAKVLDFGVAKLLGPLEGLSAGQTCQGVLLGTPQYMSPEQARGQGAVDHRSDVYSLGLVFYRMYTGQAPRAPGPIGDVIARILTEPLPRPSFARADSPPGLDAWFARACAAEPSERFESAAACVDALVAAAGLQGTHLAESLARPSLLVETLDERVSASSTPSAGAMVAGAPSAGAMAAGAPSAGAMAAGPTEPSADEAFVAGGSLMTMRRGGEGGAARLGFGALPARALWALACAAAIVGAGATFARPRAADVIGMRLDAIAPAKAEGVAAAGPPAAPLGGVEAPPPAPGTSAEALQPSVAPTRPAAPASVPRVGRGRGGAATPPARAARSPAPAPAPQAAIDLGY